MKDNACSLCGKSLEGVEYVFHYGKKAHLRCGDADHEKQDSKMFVMVKLYKSTTGIIHLVLGGYICNQAIGKIKSNLEGLGSDVTCRNCRLRLNQW